MIDPILYSYFQLYFFLNNFFLFPIIFVLTVTLKVSWLSPSLTIMTLDFLGLPINYRLSLAHIWTFRLTIILSSLVTGAFEVARLHNLGSLFSGLPSLNTRLTIAFEISARYLGIFLLKVSLLYISELYVF